MVEYNVVIGSGTTPHMGPSLAVISSHFENGKFPVPCRNNGLTGVTGPGAVILNPEDFSIRLGIKAQAVNVGTSATPLPLNSFPNRRSLTLHNNGSVTVFLGDSTVTVGEGYPLGAGQDISFDIQGHEGVIFYGITSSSSEVRVLELA